jgi:hypothetical protein
MHTNTIAIFLIEIKKLTLKAYNNPLYYSLKYGKTDDSEISGKSVFYC